MTRVKKKAKKSAGPVRMKPFKGWAVVKSTTGTAHQWFPVVETREGANQILHIVNVDKRFPHRIARVLVTELGPPSPDARIEKVRTWCENAIAYDRLANAGTLVFARDILRILNAKPGRKR